MPQILTEQRTASWFAARRGKITASNAAGCLGIGPNKELWAFNQITAEKPQEENQYMRWGSQHEEHARVEYEVFSGNLVVPTGFWVHQDRPWLGCSPDGLISDDGLLELKCPQTLPESVPEHHEIQCRVQMAVCDRFWLDYFAWTQGGQFCRRLTRNLQIEADLLAKLEAFWLTYVQPGIAPSRRKPA